MTIRRKLRFVMSLSLALGVLLVAIFTAAEREINRVERKKDTLAEISEKTFQLSLLARDLSRYPLQASAQTQWLSVHRSMGETLQRLEHDDPGPVAWIDRLRRKHAKLSRLFGQLQAQAAASAPAGGALADERREWALLRMDFSAHAMIADALSLERWTRLRLTQYRRAVYLLALALAGFATILIALLAHRVGRSITGPLTRLRQDTKIIGAGNLTYRVAMPTDDELGELSRDIDRMLVQLRAATASREDLQREVANRLRAEEELRSSEDVFKQAQSIAHLGNWEWDIASGKLRWSDEIYRIFGRKPQAFEATYEAFLATVHPDDRDAVMNGVNRALAGAGYDIVHRIRLPAGEVRIVREAGKVIFGAAGAPVRMIGTVHDITDYKRLEAELRQLNESLEKRVAEEVAKNREQDLILSQQARLAVMGQMIHNIAHQWKQPLNALSIVLANIKDAYDYHELTAESLDEALQHARRLLVRMSTTIDDFSDFFRPDREAAVFDIGHAVDEALAVMAASLQSHQIEVVRTMASGLKAFGFRNQFAHAVLNLIANAKEAIAQRRVQPGRIEIGLVEEHGTGRLTVKDNGGGIPADILPKMFDPYVTTKEQGSGIGLHLTRTIIERHLEGTIEARNEGDGALFILSLPLAAGDRQGSSDH